MSEIIGQGGVAASLSETTRQKGRRTSGASMIAILAGMPMLFAPIPAFAQAAQQAAEAELADEAGESEIVVTGTRISGFNAPTPVTSFNAEQLEEKAASTVSELLDDVPQLRINQNIGKSSESIGYSAADLRALGAARTLVLIDGRRVAATDPQGVIDTNIVPVALINSVEIVTGGASAAYGSDAVAGVVNFRLNHELEGVRADISYGESREDDFRRPSFSGAWGDVFMDGRLHIVAAGDYLQNDGQTSQASRDWGSHETVLLANPASTPANGLPRLIIADNAHFSTMTPGGLIGGTTVASRAQGMALAQLLGFPTGSGVQFGPNGQPVPFEYGTAVGASFMIGGNPFSLTNEGNLFPELERMTGYLRVSYDVTPDVEFFADVLRSRVLVDADLAPNYDAGNRTIQRDNAFLPASVRNAMVTAGYTSVAFGRADLESGNALFSTQTDVTRYTIGLQGEFSDWAWDVSAQIARNEYEFVLANNRVEARWFNALDSVISPSTGQPVCRVQVTNPNPTDTTDPYRDIRDCVPVNPFGAGSISSRALAYYGGESFYRSEQNQDVFAANVSGSPFNTWAGAVDLAFGAEHRREETNLTADANSALSRWRSINTQPYSGEYDVTEGYVEAVVPLASNFQLNTAVRYTDYSTSGGVTTWKVGANYEPFSDLRLRATLSRDIRAPNNYELFSRGNQVINSIIDPAPAPAGGQYQVRQITSGNPNLKPEEADTFTAGFVYQPGWLPGLRASIDYYTITIEGALASVAPQLIVNFCDAGQLQYCASVIRNSSTGRIDQINIVPFNADSQETSGIDVEAQYQFDLGPGQMSVRGLVNYVQELVTTSNGVSTDYVGHLGVSYPPIGVPQWRYNIDARYELGALAFGASYRYIGGGSNDVRDNVTRLDRLDNSIEGIGYVDLNIAYDLTEAVQLYGRVENLFDENPPITPNAIIQPTIANSQYYDTRGTYFIVGGRLRLD
jgi:outer membrane receptor protein involved in Fe transport